MPADNSSDSDCDRMLHTETLQDEFGDMLTGAGLPTLAAIPLNTTNDSGSNCTLTVHNLNNATLDLIRDVYRGDFELIGIDPLVLP